MLFYKKYPWNINIWDAGAIGDVNQGLEGMQEKYGALRVADVNKRSYNYRTRYSTRLRGLRPKVEIQYLDYLRTLSKLWVTIWHTLQYRTVGKQKKPINYSPAIAWRDGTLASMEMINAIRGIHVLVPRNMHAKRWWFFFFIIPLLGVQL
jgi:pyruvate/2-oxoglutarate/acetoin dehydrogenase E1 component